MQRNKVKKNIRDISVLIVDDNLINQKVLSYSILRYGAKFFFANNGQIAVDKYAEIHYELILMDINMPVMDGLEATRNIRNFEKIHNLKASVIVAISANYIEEEREKYLSYGLDEIIHKPLDFNKFKFNLSNYFEF